MTSTGSDMTLTRAVPSGLSSQNLLLDSDIRDWVVLPLLVIMITAGLLRHYLGIVLKGSNKKIPYVEGRAKGSLARASRLRSGASNFITSQKWEARRRYMSAKEGGMLRDQAEWAEEEASSEKNAASGMDPANPMAMMDGMKGQMAFMVQNMVMMQGISHFFQGFVLVKVPFPLTQGFKGMFQRGLNLGTLDTSYVSSVSWYFLVMYGLRAFFRLVIGTPTQEMQETGKIQQDLGMQPSAGPQKFDAPGKLRMEADNLELMPRHKSNMDDVEKRLLGSRYPKKKVNTSAADDFFGQIAAKQKKDKKYFPKKNA
mmetsp:Transcript_19599/g.25701  ORF Transcript_19599/g.25701 Transcript_19599/m.25701 type:complete len:313 (+) Transcript_19599:166-1104(+)|eukprot:CAMPEP_0195257562 /NCGR_PEP_ID=MMETSP0706-20130129/6891_1 /TAXON_ID=33640 /ORGANISM="Asterionellopsis glacialis, Strain CCMP134" /LENGTH=312 /DNA_ID=CAMNT_0040310791 /DNA_START=66 /DNA_END=1004 /DNA_ORIENTATION=-